MRARYFVESVYNGGQNIVLHPVAGKNARTVYDDVTRKAVVAEPAVPPPAENSAFFGASPGGEIKLLVVSPENAPEFAVGREFFVDFTPAS